MDMMMKPTINPMETIIMGSSKDVNTRMLASISLSNESAILRSIASTVPLCSPNQMSVMDGNEALKILRSAPDTRDMKVIAFTSLAIVGDKGKLLEAGFNGYISKPFNTREISKNIEGFLTASL